MFCEDIFKISCLLPFNFEITEKLVKLGCSSTWKSQFCTKPAFRLWEFFLKHSHGKIAGKRRGSWKLTGEVFSHFIFWFSGMCLVPAPRGAVWFAVIRVSHLTSYVPNVVAEEGRATLPAQPLLRTTSYAVCSQQSEQQQLFLTLLKTKGLFSIKSSIAFTSIALKITKVMISPICL